MKVDIDFDFDKICQSNIAVKNWLDVFGIKQSDIFLFLNMVDKEDYASIQNITQEQIQELSKSKDVLLYTKSVENEIIAKYYKMIHYVAKQMGIKNNSDDYLSFGFEGLRKALFYYKDQNSSFKTYCFNGIKHGLQHWQYHQKPVKNQIIRPMLATDVMSGHNEYKFEEAAVYKFDSDEDDVADTIRNLAGDREKFIELIDMLAKHANISALDKKIILGMTFDNSGRNGWVEKFISLEGLTCTKATIYNRYNQGVNRLHKAFLQLGLEF